MSFLSEYTIPFQGLKQGINSFEFNIDNTFFDSFNYNEFEYSKFKVVLLVNKKNSLMEFDFSSEGEVEVVCDISNEPFNKKIQSNLDLVIKFGEIFDDSNDDFIVLPYNTVQFDVKQYIYEMIVLSIPIVKKHPKLIDGTLKSKTVDYLNKISSSESKIKKEEYNNPQFEKLKVLL